MSRLQSFPFDKLRALQARHHKFFIGPIYRGERVSRLFPADFFDSYEVSLNYRQFTGSLKDSNPQFLAKVTELDVTVDDDSPSQLDLRYLPSLRHLYVTDWDERLISLQCHPLKDLTLIDMKSSPAELMKHPISAKRVLITGHESNLQLGTRGGLALSQLFPDTEHLSFIDLEYDYNPPFVLRLDSMPKLRHLEVRSSKYRLTAKHPIHLSSLVMQKVDAVSETITASRLVCDRVSVALQMLRQLRHVTFFPTCDVNHDDDSLLKLPRCVEIDFDESFPFDELRSASCHMLLNRCIGSRHPESIHRTQEYVFYHLESHLEPDNALLLRVLREAQDVSQFKWRPWCRNETLVQAFEYMLELKRPIDWSRIVNRWTEPAALSYLLSQQPAVATRAFGEEKMTLLHALGRRRESAGLGDQQANEQSLALCLLKHGADPLARNAQGRTPLDDWPQLRTILNDRSHLR